MKSLWIWEIGNTYHIIDRLKFKKKLGNSWNYGLEKENDCILVVILFGALLSLIKISVLIIIRSERSYSLPWKCQASQPWGTTIFEKLEL